MDWSEHLPKLTAFWCRALLDLPGYDGNPFRAHSLVHAQRAFTPEHFERWLTLFHETIELGWIGPNARRARRTLPTTSPAFTVANSSDTPSPCARRCSPHQGRREIASYYVVLSLHILGAAVWAGGHLVLAVTILPDALRRGRAATVSEFEQRFERIGLPALAVQIVTGLWLAEHLLGSPAQWFDAEPVARTVQVKLALLAVTRRAGASCPVPRRPATLGRDLAHTGLAHPNRHPGGGAVRAGRRQHPIRRLPRVRTVIAR